MPQTPDPVPVRTDTPEGTVPPPVVTVPPPPVLPPDGTKVRATTLPSIEYDREAEEVEGVLYTVLSPFGPPPNCYVDGIGVEPESVVAIPDAAPADGAAG